MNKILHFTNSEAFYNWEKVSGKPEVGQIIHLTDTEEYKYYDGENLTNFPQNTEVNSSGINLNLYDLNKSIISQLPALTSEELRLTKEIFCEYYKKNLGEYYMLLCKDISYYTMFTNVKPFPEFNRLGSAVIDCVLDVGDIISIAPTEDKGAIEIWVKTSDSEILVMYFFNADRMVVSFKEG